MNNITVFKTTYHMNDRIYFTNICKELVSKPLSFRSTFYKSGDINKFNCSRNNLCRIIHIRQYFKTLIRNGNNTNIRIYSTEWIIGRLCSSLCQRVK